MTTTIKILTVLLVIFLISCNPTRNNENKILANDASLILKDTINQLPLKLSNILPESFLFKYSKCIENCNDGERIISRVNKGDSLFLKIGSIQNCIGRFRPEIKFYNDTLAILIKIKEEIRKRKNGKIDTLIVTEDCECYFYFNIGIKNLNGKPKTILLGGHNIGSLKFKGLRKTDNSMME